MNHTYLVTGSYSNAEEQGIKLWEFNHQSGSLTEIAGTFGIDRPSFLAIHPNGKSFAATSEVGDGDLVAYEFMEEPLGLKEINRQPANGDHPAHVCIDHSGKWLLSANYSGGNVNVYPIAEDGSIGERTDSIKHEGSGPNAERQDAPHPHSVFQIPQDARFIVSDLGTDMLYIYKLDQEAGKLELEQSIEAPPGSGPRHLTFHPSSGHIYSLEEITSSLTVYEWNDAGSLNAIQRVSLLPDGFEGKNTSAEVRVSADGRYLYASNRGDDSLAVFAIGEDGKLELTGFSPSGGEGPRHFELISGGQWMIAANERSHNLAVLKIGKNGMPEFAGEIAKTKAPVCVKSIGGR
ncbi:lactonase family protein [Planococcus sp. NCCP-2050]|uniref:lactonase family protein n=1 Tax=Planococcus sp. NCCP-2050 TaxID=2944679 RepID=UPI00204215B0|nr:lactonase family protein [Planococcus sp. NCCP-2050]GKW46411.1 hypothetical protein NCCP2050_21030 [Planococcus sp. NCCP-2050]